MAQGNQEFERLKQKYQPVLNLMKQLQVQVQNVNMEGTKLFIRGAAPSADIEEQDLGSDQTDRRQLIPI